MLTADSDGHFAVTNAPLAEGDNLLVAVASDSTGTTPSAGRLMTVETIPPAALSMNAPFYTPGEGLTLSWALPQSGKASSSYQLFWANAPFTSTNQATGHSISLSSTFYKLQAIPDGTYYFGVVGYDTAGNASPLSTLVSTVYDSTPPTLTVSYNPAPPVGVVPLNIILSSSEALAVAPSLTFRPAGAYSPVLLNLTNVALNTWQTAFSVGPGTASGAVEVQATAQDLVGNVFSGTPGGPRLVFDTTPPSGAITTTPPAPIQTTNSTNVIVTLALTESARPGAPPALSFTPPQGPSVIITLGGAGSNWSGTLPVTPAMGSGFGQFSLSVLDAAGNLGSNLVSGSRLELYNSALPSPPAAPLGLVAQSLPGRQIKLAWNISSNAQVYRLYREPGTNLVAPTVLVMDNIAGTSTVDVPPIDGAYRYGVTASRLGAESGLSNVVVAVADGTPPPAPVNVVAALASSGVQISWQQPSGELPDHYRIYRNGTAIAAATSLAPVVDYPPKGTNTYVVAAVDAVGNENPSAPAVLQLLAGPVNNLSVMVAAGQPVLLNWSATDPQTSGFNLYRNGIKQNTSILATNNYGDNLALSGVTQYAVTAVNQAGQESPFRSVNVYPLGLDLLVNPAGTGTNQPVLADYFDQYQATVTVPNGAQIPQLAQVNLTRTIPGLDLLTVTQTVTSNLVAGTAMELTFVVPEPPLLATQTVQIVVAQQTDSQGSQVNYEKSFTVYPSPLRDPEIDLAANQLPLAGGLNSFQVQVHNPGYVDIQFIVSRDSGASPGDFYISVLNSLGQEVSRTPFQGTPPGTFFLPDGRAYATVKAGATLSFTVPNVLVPAALGGATNVIFEAVAGTIYNQFGTPNDVASGPLTGRMISSGLAQPPYYGTAKTDKLTYANDDAIVITGQAVNTTSGAPVANAALNIGFASRGHSWFVPVTTDSSGNYQYTYDPPLGFAGLLTIWAANPLVVDELNQASAAVYRMYCTPSGANITMSKNDTFNFTLQLINPGDLLLTGLSCSFNAYQMSGTNRIPVASVTGTNLSSADAFLQPNERKQINLQLSTALAAPDALIVEYAFSSAEGAALTFVGTMTLMPAVPVVSVANPASGYLEASVNRGDQRSAQITVMNTGLSDLRGVTLTPPTNTLWMQVNLPISSDGLIHLPDLAEGQSNTFTVILSPPPETPLAFYQDVITIAGTNSATSFPVQVYALVTSHSTGGVQFFVDDILGQAVPNATVRLHSDVLLTEPPPVETDTNGLVTITNLQEGVWDWQVTAAGCSSTMGTVNIVADQTQYQHTRLSRSLVSITFTVVPVPFTDTYEVKVEQTYETHVTAPVIVLDPPFVHFSDATPGFEANFVVNVKNYGLIQITDVNITGRQNGGAELTPLITYIPVLLPMQSVDVPFALTYNTPSGTGGSPNVRQDGGDFSNCGDGIPGLNGSFGGSYNPETTLGIGSVMEGTSKCESDDSDQEEDAALSAALGVGQTPVGQDPVASSMSNGGDVATAVAALVNCIKANLASSGPGGSGPGGGGGSGPGNGLDGSGGPSSLPDAGTGNGCFAPGSPVLMADGSSKPISAIVPNDIVRTGPNPWNVAAVNGAFRTTAAGQRIIQFTGSSFSEPRRLAATAEHLFWVDGKGWTSAQNLAVGDWLSDPQGRRLTVTQNEGITVTSDVFTLSLARDNAFYVNGVLVHDACGKAPNAPAKTLPRATR